jgi:hypothetical protein
VKHYPGFCDTGEPEEARFNTVKELLKIKWVKSFAKDPTFYKFGMDEEHLMATYKKGKEWWVVGSITYPREVKLPKILNYDGNKATFEPESRKI